MKMYYLFQNRFTCNWFIRCSILIVMIFYCLFVFSCGGSTSDDNTSNTDTPTDSGSNGSIDNLESISLVWTYDPELKNPVTDLADCIQSVIDCIGRGTALDNCFDSDIKICTGAEPTDFCCTQECADQIIQELAIGSTDHDTILKVLVYDGTCMPNIPEDPY
jgi:hypothetical protein